MRFFSPVILIPTVKNITPIIKLRHSKNKNLLSLNMTKPINQVTV